MVLSIERTWHIRVWGICCHMVQPYSPGYTRHDVTGSEPLGPWAATASDGGIFGLVSGAHNSDQTDDSCRGSWCVNVSNSSHTLESRCQNKVRYGYLCLIMTNSKGSPNKYCTCHFYYSLATELLLAYWCCNNFSFFRQIYWKVLLNDDIIHIKCIITGCWYLIHDYSSDTWQSLFFYIPCLYIF